MLACARGDDQQAVFAQLLLQTQQALLIPGFEEFVRQRRCGDEADSQTLLTGRQPKAESNMCLAGPVVSYGDEVLVTGDVITARPAPSPASCSTRVWP